MYILLGDIVNFLTVLAGGCVGLMIRAAAARAARGKQDAAALKSSVKRAGRMESLRTTLMQGIALCVVLIGINGAVSGVYTTGQDGAQILQSPNTLNTILSMVIGIAVGEFCDLDGLLRRFGDWIERKMRRGKPVEGAGQISISEGFVSASLLFCVGAMAIVGGLKSGISGDHSMLYTKSVLDGISSIVFASTMGAGVLLSAFAVLLYQGAIVLASGVIAPYLTDACIIQMNCVGSLLIIAIGLNLLGVTKIKVMNGVPAIFLPILLCQIIR